VSPCFEHSSAVFFRAFFWRPCLAYILIITRLWGAPKGGAPALPLRLKPQVPKSFTEWNSNTNNNCNQLMRGLTPHKLGPA
jgi:hypothetical protein